MAETEPKGHQQQQDSRPQVLLFGHLESDLITVFPIHLLNNKFNFLKPWDSPSIPLHQFLRTHAQHVMALLSINAPVDAQTLHCLPSLQCLVTTSVGLNHIDLPECKRRGVVITNAGSVYSEDAADYAVGLLLDVLRRVSASDRYVRSRFWPVKGDYPLAHKLGGKHVGIVGLGKIGLEIAKRLEAFGCSISYTSRKEKPSVPFPYYPNAFDLATKSDILILSCPLTDETYHIINKDVLSALGKNGIIVKVGRGPLIDEKELVSCLVQGELGGAGLDVFENEPNVPKELFELDNVVLSPHNAVGTPESLLGLFGLVVANLEAFFSNKPLLSPVKYE